MFNFQQSIAKYYADNPMKTDNLSIIFNKAKAYPFTLMQTDADTEIDEQATFYLRGRLAPGIHLDYKGNYLATADQYSPCTPKLEHSVISCALAMDEIPENVIDDYQNLITRIKELVLANVDYTDKFYIPMKKELSEFRTKNQIVHQKWKGQLIEKSLNLTPEEFAKGSPEELLFSRLNEVDHVYKSLAPKSSRLRRSKNIDFPLAEYATGDYVDIEFGFQSYRTKDLKFGLHPYLVRIVLIESAANFEDVLADVVAPADISPRKKQRIVRE